MAERPFYDGMYDIMQSNHVKIMENHYKSLYFAVFR